MEQIQPVKGRYVDTHAHGETERAEQESHQNVDDNAEREDKRGINTFNAGAFKALFGGGGGGGAGAAGVDMPQVKALAKALNITPAKLLGAMSKAGKNKHTKPKTVTATKVVTQPAKVQNQTVTVQAAAATMAPP